ncbi:NACHT, LRR and PYD domains-containing protein 11 [Trichechus inunguis]
MAASSSTDSDLLWYLEKLDNKEFQSVKEHLIRAPLEFGLPEIPWLQLRKAQQEDLDKILTTNYEAHITWNMMFSIFQKISRQDLCEEIDARRNRNKETYKNLIIKKLLLQWEEGIYPKVHDDFYDSIASGIFRVFEMIFDPKYNLSSDNFNVFLIGERAAGKTMLIKMAVILWVSGRMWKDTFSYIIHLTSREINQMAHSSFVELLSKDWPDSRAPVADILSDSQKLLFILEDLDNIKFILNMDESALCSDSRKQVPVLVLLVSLFKRKMAPGSSFLISTRPGRQDAMDALLKETDYSINLNFIDEIRQRYFTLFFKDSRKATIAFKFVQENEMLVDLCNVPILCWVVCMTLNHQMDKADDVKLKFRTSTDIHAHFLTNALMSEPGMVAGQHHLVLLERLCWLALEGLLQDVLDFSNQDLRSVGLTEADVSVLQTTNILTRSSNCEDHCTFIHLRVQEFCAAIAYMRPLIASLLPSTSKEKERRAEYKYLSPIMTCIFGLLNKKTRDILETSFGCQLLSEMHRQYFLEQMENLGANPTAMEHHVPLFYCLFENQEEEFVKQIMGFFVEATIFIQENKDLMVSSYCLKRCHTLQKLRLCIQGIFEKVTVKLTSSQMRSLTHWRDICSLLYTKENLRELEICNSKLDNTSERILCKALGHPSCLLQTLKLTYLAVDARFEDLFKAIVHNRNLTHLSLTCMPVSLKMFSLLREVLANPMCNIQHLSLMKCDLKTSTCEEISSILINSKKLKRLSLSNNPLNNNGVKILCDALLHPGCALESLVLFFCCLTETSCSSIGRVVMLSRTIKHLDVSVNYLQNHGALVLILSLMMPTCQLQELELSGCFFTTDVCRDIAAAIITNKNLRSLELGSNNIGDAGVELLCNALKHPTCNLENLGLEECMLTNACCESIASVLISSKTLKKLSLLGNELDEEGIVQLLQGLGHPDCILQTIG